MFYRIFCYGGGFEGSKKGLPEGPWYPPLGRAPKGPEFDLFMKEFLIGSVGLNFGFLGLPGRGGAGSGFGRVVCCLGACLALVLNALFVLFWHVLIVILCQGFVTSGSCLCPRCVLGGG